MRFDRLPLRRGAPLAARLRACCTICVSAGLLSCGGRAADGVEPEAGGLGASVPGNDGNDGVVRPVRETCEDNPLLAGCPYAGMGAGSSPPEQPIEIPEPAGLPDERTLAISRAENVLLTNCGGCHGSVLTAEQASAGINYIDDWGELIRARLIVPCLPGRSRIIAVMRTNAMPPPVSGLAPVTDAEIDLVAGAIELECVD